MLELPQIDPAKILERDNLKLEADNREYRKQITHLELLAEALRDQRDAALEENERLQAALENSSGEAVPDISSLGK